MTSSSLIQRLTDAVCCITGTAGGSDVVICKLLMRGACDEVRDNVCINEFTISCL